MMVKNTLMVIGNGFDLQCKLNSCYRSFFDWLSEDDARANDNIWTVHFLNAQYGGAGWVDIENQLQKTLNKTASRSNKNVGIHYNITLPKFWNEIAISYFKLKSNGGGHVYPRGKEADYLVENVNRIGRSSFPLSSQWFLDELKAFERQFSDYLQKEVNNNTDYISNAVKLIEMMSNDEDKIHILNFNYTNPFKLESSKSADNTANNLIKSITNVHGTCSECNIIFGTDATETLLPDTHIFTKTYRKMLQSTPKNALPSNIEEIRFYGHSLGQADYSYFQSVFDYYNLYDGRRNDSWNGINPITLKFYYTVYDDSKEIEIRRDAADSVYKLISAYGDTLDNKDKGKNLMHKLLVEGRVQIIFIEGLD